MAMRRAIIKDTSACMIAGRVGRPPREGADSPVAPRPHTAPLQGFRTEPFEPAGPFRFGRDPIPALPRSNSGSGSTAKPRRGGDHAASLALTEEELRREDSMDADFRFRVPSSPSSYSYSQKQQQQRERCGSPSGSLSLLDSSLAVGEAAMTSRIASEWGKAVDKDKVVPKRVGIREMRSASRYSTKSTAAQRRMKKENSGVIHSSSMEGSLLYNSKDALLQETLKRFCKVGYVEDKPIAYMDYWKEKLVRYLTSVESAAALRKKMMTANRLSPVKLSVPEIVCALAETDGNVGEIRVKAKDLKFFSEIKLVGSVVRVKDVVASVIPEAAEFFDAAANPFTASAASFTGSEPQQMSSSFFIPRLLAKEDDDSSSHSDGLLTEGSNDEATSEADSFLAPLGMRGGLDKAAAEPQPANDSASADGSHPHARGQDAPTFTTPTGILLHQKSYGVRKRASVIRLTTPVPVPTISPVASLYFQRLQSQSVGGKKDSSTAGKMPFKEFPNLVEHRSNSRHDDASEESSNHFPDFDEDIQGSLDHYIDDLTNAYKQEEKDWRPVVKNELVENTFKAMSKKVMLPQNFMPPKLQESLPSKPAVTPPASQSPSPWQSQSLIQQPEKAIQQQLSSGTAGIQPSHQTLVKSLSTVTPPQRVPPSSLSYQPMQSQGLQQGSTHAQTAKKSVRISNTITSMFEQHPDSQSIGTSYICI